MAQWSAATWRSYPLLFSSPIRPRTPFFLFLLSFFFCVLLFFFSKSRASHLQRVTKKKKLQATKACSAIITDPLHLHPTSTSSSFLLVERHHPPAELSSARATWEERRSRREPRRRRSKRKHRGRRGDSPRKLNLTFGSGNFFSLVGLKSKVLGELGVFDPRWNLRFWLVLIVLWAWLLLIMRWIWGLSTKFLVGLKSSVQSKFGGFYPS